MRIRWLNSTYTMAELTRGWWRKEHTTVEKCLESDLLAGLKGGRDKGHWYHVGTNVEFKDPYYQVNAMDTYQAQALAEHKATTSADLWTQVPTQPRRVPDGHPYRTSLFLAVAWLVGTVSTVNAAPVVGQHVLYKYDDSHIYDAVVSAVVSGDTINMVAFSNGSTWYNTVPSSVPAFTLYSVDKGTGDNRWGDNPNVGLTGPTGATGATGTTGATGPGALVTSTSTSSFTLNGSAVQLNSTHDTIVAMSVSFSLPLSVIAGATGTVHLICDNSGTPTTEVFTLSRGNAGGLLTTDTSTLAFLWRVPAGHFCKFTTTQDVGSPTFGIVRQFVQVLGN